MDCDSVWKKVVFLDKVSSCQVICNLVQAICGAMLLVVIIAAQLHSWTHVLGRLKSCTQHVGDLSWWGSLLAVLPHGKKTKHPSSVNHTTETIHHHHHHQQQQQQQQQRSVPLKIYHWIIWNKMNNGEKKTFPKFLCLCHLGITY